MISCEVQALFINRVSRIQEYVNRGITFLAAAIGDDKPAIKRCYGEGAFLDITDLKAFPTTIAKIIARYALE